MIETSFNEQKLKPRNVYFLNTQKLGKNALLVRTADPAASAQMWDSETQPSMPDLRTYTFWDTLANTINDESLTLYLILDEAHRGMRATTREQNERSTIVKSLIHGDNAGAPVPVVWGISATISRFEEAMRAAGDPALASNRTTRSAVVIDPVDIQQTGLLKGILRLDFPETTRGADLVLLARGVQAIREYEREWNLYTTAEGQDPVRPLLLVQVANTPSDADLINIVQTVHEQWPELAGGGIAHVFGEHQDLALGSYLVPYISPELVQDSTHIRVLLAKDAISTGWDCPRAEVLVSFRPATDPTHITQLLGRVVRTPLARAIAGNDALNSVECLLPRFNRQATEAIAGILRGEGTDGSGAGSPAVLIAPKRLDVNAAIDAGVWDAFDNLPTQTLPKKAAKPLKRLALLAQNLAHDNLRPDAIKETNSLLYAKLDGLATQHQAAVAEEEQKIMTVAGQTLTVMMASGAISASDFFVTGDRSIVAVAFADGARKLTRALAKGYALHLADRDTSADQDDTLEAAELHVAALARVSDVGEELDIYATKLATDLFDQYRVQFKDLNETRQGVYDDLLAMSTQPQRTATARPVSRVVETKGADGQDLPVAEKHLMSDAGGHFPIGDLRPEERTVLATEINRTSTLAWYRNPVGTTRRDAVRVAYTDVSGRWRVLCPDFLFFSGPPDDVKVSIVDPHGHHLSDALVKLRGLAAFVEAFGDEFHRVESINKIGSQFRVLDIKHPAVRAAIARADSAEALFSGDVAANYTPDPAV